MSLNCFFVSDLHGHIDRYQKLFERVKQERPDALFMGGDLLPTHFAARGDHETPYKDFARDFLVKEFNRLKELLGDAYPRVFVILGNDDGKMGEPAMSEGDSQGVWDYCHNRCVQWGDYRVYGYACVPPTPFRLKDWERFDVTDYVRPGCISPTDPDAVFTVPVDERALRTGTIEEDLKKLAGDDNLEKAIFLFHSPPHRSKLDLAGLDDQLIDDLQVDVHVGSSAIQRFIKRCRPLVTLHGHIHESSRITGFWRDKFHRTEAFNASHDGPELSLVRFDSSCPGKATRELI